MNEIEKFKILSSFSIREAVKHMDEVGVRFCVCVEDDNVLGVITDGDFRHAVHNGIQLDENVLKIINRDFYFLSKNYTNAEIENIFNNTIVRKIPILESGKMIDVISFEEFYSKDKTKKRRKLDNPVVIMAGGKGTRLDPFTRILPKPLIPLGDEPIIKVIMDEFYKYGLNEFYISLKDKGRMVRAYFYEHDLGYQIKYVYESQPLGTAGALKYLENKMMDSFFVSNCDIIIRADYGAFYDFHKQGRYSLTMVASMQQYTIPYGICEIDNGGMLKKIIEKPQYDFLVNTGLYLLDPEVLECIPSDTYFNMTDLIQKVQEQGLRVGIFPVSEKSWIDVGQWEDYTHLMNDLDLDGNKKKRIWLK